MINSSIQKQEKDLVAVWVLSQMKENTFIGPNTGFNVKIKIILKKL